MRPDLGVEKRSAWQSPPTSTHPGDAAWDCAEASAVSSRPSISTCGAVSIAGGPAVSRGGGLCHARAFYSEIGPHASFRGSRPGDGGVHFSRQDVPILLHVTTAALPRRPGVRSLDRMTGLVALLLLAPPIPAARERGPRGGPGVPTGRADYAQPWVGGELLPRQSSPSSTSSCRQAAEEAAGTRRRGTWPASWTRSAGASGSGAAARSDREAQRIAAADRPAIRAGLAAPQPADLRRGQRLYPTGPAPPATAPAERLLAPERLALPTRRCVLVQTEASRLSPQRVFARRDVRRGLWYGRCRPSARR